MTKIEKLERDIFIYTQRCIGISEYEGKITVENTREFKKILIDKILELTKPKIDADKFVDKIQNLGIDMILSEGHTLGSFDAVKIYEKIKDADIFEE